MTRSPRRDYCAGSTLPRRSLSLFHARRDRVANPLDTASHSDRTLLTTGLCGSARLADVGGVPNLVPLVTRSKVRASCCGCSKPKKKKKERRKTLDKRRLQPHFFTPKGLQLPRYRQVHRAAGRILHWGRRRLEPSRRRQLRGQDPLLPWMAASSSPLSSRLLPVPGAAHTAPALLSCQHR